MFVHTLDDIYGFKKQQKAIYNKTQCFVTHVNMKKKFLIAANEQQKRDWMQATRSAYTSFRMDNGYHNYYECGNMYDRYHVIQSKIGNAYQVLGSDESSFRDLETYYLTHSLLVKQYGENHVRSHMIVDEPFMVLNGKCAPSCIHSSGTYGKWVIVDEEKLLEDNDDYRIMFDWW